MVVATTGEKVVSVGLRPPQDPAPVHILLTRVDGAATTAHRFLDRAWVPLFDVVTELSDNPLGGIGMGSVVQNVWRGGAN